MAAVSQPANTQLSSAIDGVGVRVLMLGWCVWLLGSWAVTLTLDSPAAAVRWMVFATFTGLVIIWPTVRLSQETSADSASAATPLIDWLCLILIFQAVVWPLCLVAGWSWRQALWIDAAISSWSLLAGAIVALGRRFASPSIRMLAMAVCLLLVLGAPTVRVLAGGGPGAAGDEGFGWIAGFEPIAVLWELTHRRADVQISTVAPAIIAAAIAAVAAWVGVWITGVWGAGPERQESQPDR